MISKRIFVLAAYPEEKKKLLAREERMTLFLFYWLYTACPALAAQHEVVKNENYLPSCPF